MARPRNNDRRSAIISAAIRLIASQGLGAPTATIAKEAGISNGSLFTYFHTKTDLLNHLYVELKTEMAAVALDGVPTESHIREQMFQMWSRWLRWAACFPDKRRALAHLAVSDDITPASHQAGKQSMAGIAKLLERSRENGHMRDASRDFVTALMTSLADTTIDFMIQGPANADKHCTAAFDALWRMVT